MELTKISRALVALGLAATASTAWAACPGDPGCPDPSTGTVGVPLTNPAGTAFTSTGTAAPTTTTTSTFTLSGTAPTGNGSATSGAVQGTIGGPGGVGGLGPVTRTTTATYTVGTNLTKATTAQAGSVLSGVTLTAATVLSSGSAVLAGDKIVTISTYGTGIKNTAHDFASRGTNQITPGLCTFCHTPHKAAQTLLLWNHTPSANTFSWEVAATTAGTALPGFTGSYSGPSAKCLACHDGSVALGDVGWFQNAARTGTGAMRTSSLSATYQVGAGGHLQGVHPVAIPYPLNGAPNAYNGSTTGARLATSDFVADPTAYNMRLYTDIGGGTIVGKVTPGSTGVECSTCHDPHNKAAIDRYFLRGTMTGSSTSDGYICTACHIK